MEGYNYVHSYTHVHTLMSCYIRTNKLECAYIAMWLQKNTLTYVVSLKPRYESCSYLQYLCK